MEEIKRVVKWSEEAKKFWEAATDKSVDLQVMVSYGNISQTEMGFEDLVNSLNCLENKLKKVTITDTSYLYRHCIPEFSSYCNTDTPTVWYMNNKKVIEKLKVPVVMDSWPDSLQTKEYKKWYNIILSDYEKIKDFRDVVVEEASVAAYKRGNDIKDCIMFMIEECAHSCAFLNGVNLCYSGSPARCMMNAFKRYGMQAKIWSYRVSRQAQRDTSYRDIYRDGRLGMLDKEIALFMREKVSNVNFFVMDRFGNHIYKNYALENNINFKDYDASSWDNSCKVMQSKEARVFEEKFKNKTYLSVKSPFVINNEVEGVIGLAVDITAKKEKERLERQQEKYELVRSIAHDIRTPLCILSTIVKEASLPEDNYIMARNSLERIDRILREVIARHDGSVEFQKEQYTCIQMTLKEVVRCSCCKYSNINFEYIDDENVQDYIFIRADYSDFCRAVINLINNAAEACTEGGKVRVGFIKKGGNVVIFVKDNGVGISPDTIEKINSSKKVLEVKENGHGLGLQQVYKVMDGMHGKLTVQSKKNEETEFRIDVAICENPQWFLDKVSLREGDIVVALDDDLSMLELWKRTFQPFEGRIVLKVFEKGLEAVKFINSQENKSKVFLLADYELRNQPLNGIDAIERTNMHERHLLVTSSYVSAIRNFDDKKHFLKVFYKPEGIDKIKFTVS